MTIQQGRWQASDHGHSSQRTRLYGDSSGDVEQDAVGFRLVDGVEGCEKERVVLGGEVRLHVDECNGKVGFP